LLHSPYFANDLWQKWGVHVHPSPPRGYAPEHGNHPLASAFFHSPLVSKARQTVKLLGSNIVSVTASCNGRRVCRLSVSLSVPSGGATPGRARSNDLPQKLMRWLSLWLSPWLQNSILILHQYNEIPIKLNNTTLKTTLNKSSK